MVLDAEDPPPVEKAVVIPNTIISYVIWERFGHSPAAKARWVEKNTWQNLLDKSTTLVEAWSISLKYERRDADTKRLTAISEASKANMDECFADISELWNLELLVTDRSFRGRGAATRLVEWGTAQADEEGVCCAVAASGMGARVYRACGFKKLNTGLVQVQGQSESLQYDVMRRDSPLASGSPKLSSGL